MSRRHDWATAGLHRDNSGPTILAIDPGPEQSAWLELGGDGRPVAFAIERNKDLLVRLRRFASAAVDVIVIEQVESFGMAVGREVFETVRWAGRFEEAANQFPVVLLPRRVVKLRLCRDSRARDANIRAALLDRFGGAGAVGVKAHPGPLYGVARDVWSALAIAVAYREEVMGEAA